MTNTEQKVNTRIAKNILQLMEATGANKTMIAGMLELKTSTVTELLKGNVNWKVNHLITIASYFDVTIDFIVFKGGRKQSKINIKRKMQRYLIKEKKYNTLGFLTGIDYFKLNNNENE